MTDINKEHLEIFGVGFGIASMLLGLFLLIKEWDSAYWIAKVLCLSLIVGAFGGLGLWLFRECIPSNHKKKDTNTSA